MGGKPTNELEDQAMWVQDAFGAINNAPIECIDPSVTTVCGSVLDAMVVDLNSITVNCENNICTFDCTKDPLYPDVVPNHAFTTCGIHPNETDFTFLPKEPINCIAKPDDTECGDGQLAQPPVSSCDKDNKVFGHPLNTPIRCY